MAEALPPQYDPAETEEQLYRWWEEQGFFHAGASSERDPYVIVIPPPNVTAMLHMGHGLNNTVQDMLVRWRRMQGRETLWMPGTDHAGIATQNVVERQLAKRDLTRFDIGREAFIREVWDFVDETGATILGQLRAIGSSCDWERTRFTLDEGLSAAVREVFVRLYEKDLIYRGNYIINWCPRCATALSDEEAEPKDTNGKLYHLRYPLANPAEDGSPRYIVVATTRPETMLGDTAVAVHPEDSRYSGLIGAEIQLPLTERRIPIIADEYVDPEFGTGAVKITPAHDPNDFEMGRRHDLPSIDVMTSEASMSDAAPAAFRGLDRFEARKRVVSAFRDLDLLEKTEDHSHAVPHCYRCSTVVEPRLSDQWFVKMKPLAKPALAAYHDHKVRFTPDRFGKVYEHWLENIRDWCISRQLWWGHRIPAWYCQADGCEEIIVSREAPATCTKCGGGDLKQDPDVLDTWFSSWLWPFSTMGWPEETPDLKKFYPNHTLVSAHDIIFFWIARMIMAGIEFMDDVPFQEVYLTGMVRDHLGRKMSKSLGNGIDPIEVVNRFGADALRYTVISGSGPGSDQYLDYEDLETTFAPGRNFANKLWNAGRFALMNLGDDEVRPLGEVKGDLELADRWILSRLSRTTREITDSLERFRLNEAALTGYGFFWGEVADWYLELVKPRLRGEMGGESMEAARSTLLVVLDDTLRLLHPVMPFITETVWQRLPRRQDGSESIMTAAWPTPHAELESDADEARMAELQEIIGAVRNLRSEYGVQPALKVNLLVSDASDELREVLDASRRALEDLSRVDDLRFGPPPTGIAVSAVLRSGAQVFLPLEGVIDLDRERARLQAEIDRIGGQISSTEGKLSNEKFVSRAPDEVVQRERDKLTAFAEQAEKLRATLASLT